jgi:hypothetical protein
VRHIDVIDAGHPILIFLNVRNEELTAEDIAAIDAAGAAGARSLTVKKMLQRAAVSVLAGATIYYLLDFSVAAVA